MTNRTRVIVYFAIWIAIAAVIFWRINGFFIQRFISLEKHAGQAVGKVAEKFPHNHQSIKYTYVVDGYEFAGSMDASQIGKVFDEVRVGETLAVYFDSTNPASSSPSHPNAKETIFGLLPIIAFLTFAPPTGVLLAIHFRRKLFYTTRPSWFKAPS